MILKVDSLCKTYNSRKVLDDVSFSLSKGEVLGLSGHSGEGKSTISRILVGTVFPDSGEILFNGESIYEKPLIYKKKMHLSIQLIAQQPTSFLDPLRSVGYSLAEPLFVHSLCSKKDIDTKIEELLSSVGLPMVYKDRRPRELSGGEGSKGKYCKGNKYASRLLIADEATSMLDIETQKEIMDLLMKLKEEKGLSLILISHDKGLLKAYSDRLLALENGKIKEI